MAGWTSRPAQTPIDDLATRTRSGGETRGSESGRIVSAAIALIDRDGLNVTLRQVSGQLSIPPSALTRHYPNRNALLDAIVETLVDQLYTGPEVHPTSSDWQEHLQRVAHGVCRIALAHSRLFPLVATRPPAAPWLQPPLRSLRWMEGFLDPLHHCGFSNRDAVTACRAFCSFLLDHLLLEVESLGADIESVESANLTPIRSSDLADYPRLASMQNELSISYADNEFEEALETLLDPQKHRTPLTSPSP